MVLTKRTLLIQSNLYQYLSDELERGVSTGDADEVIDPKDLPEIDPDTPSRVEFEVQSEGNVVIPIRGNAAKYYEISK